MSQPLPLRNIKWIDDNIAKAEIAFQNEKSILFGSVGFIKMNEMTLSTCISREIASQ